MTGAYLVVDISQRHCLLVVQSPVEADGGQGGAKREGGDVFVQAHGVEGHLGAGLESFEGCMDVNAS